MTSPAGYSGTPLHRKLGIGPDSRVLVSGRPTGWDLRLLDPEGSATLHTRPGPAAYDVVLAFCPDLAALRRSLPTLLPRLTEPGRLWLCWPKRSSGVPTDLTEALVRAAGLDAGVVDMKVCAVDATWSGLCFVRRVRDRLASRA